MKEKQIKIWKEIHVKISLKPTTSVGNCVEFLNFFFIFISFFDENPRYFLSDLIIEALNSHYLDIRLRHKTREIYAKVFLLPTHRAKFAG